MLLSSRIKAFNMSPSSHKFIPRALQVVMLTGAMLALSGFSAPAQAGYYQPAPFYAFGRHRGYGRDHNYGGYRHRRHRGHNRGAYLAGGVVLGALLSHAIHPTHHSYRRSRYDDDYVIRRVVREQPVNRSSNVTRRLYRDRDGNCFQRKQQNDEELLIELDPSECAW